MGGNKRGLYLTAVVVIIVILLGTFIYLNRSEENSERNLQINGLQDRIWTFVTFENDEINLVVGQELPDFTYEILEDNTKKKISEFQGDKAVILNFWATWCPPCLKEKPLMDEIHQSHEDIVVVTVNLQESQEVTIEWLAEKGYSFNVLLDKEGELARSFNVFTIPNTIIIDNEGLVIGIERSQVKEDDVEKYIKKLYE